jgi:hypothetical protein
MQVLPSLRILYRIALGFVFERTKWSGQPDNYFINLNQDRVAHTSRPLRCVR